MSFLKIPHDYGFLAGHYAPHIYFPSRLTLEASVSLENEKKDLLLGFREVE